MGPQKPASSERVSHHSFVARRKDTACKIVRDKSGGILLHEDVNSLRFGWNLRCAGDAVFAEPPLMAAKNLKKT